MHKKLNFLSLSLLVTTLIGCGLADPTDPIEEDPDTTAPIITEAKQPSVLFSDKILPIDTTQIRLKVSEDLDENSVNALNEIQVFRPHPGSNALEGTWSFDSTATELVFDISTTDILFNQRYDFLIDNQITDLAGNSLFYQVNNITTDEVYDIIVTATGLNPGQSVEVTHEISDTLSIAVPIDTNGSPFRINSNISQNSEYLLKISQQPADGSFCTLNNSQGKMTNSDASAQVLCSEVAPFKTEAPNWNDYYTSGDSKIVHGGEQRSLLVPTHSSCIGITAEDNLKAFDWACAETVDENSNAIIQIYSTALKPPKGLSDLIAFNEKPNWKTNFITIKQDATNIKTTESAIWWNNPIYVAPTDALLDVAGAVYVVLNNDAPPQNYIFKKSKIALLVAPGHTLVSKTNNNAAIYLASVYSSWLEGDIDANSSDTGIKINTSSFTHIRNLSISNAAGNGIQLQNTLETRIFNTYSSKHGNHGITLDQNFEDYKNLLDKITVTNNGGSGLYINGSNNKITRLNAAHNQKNGVRITQPKNILSDIQISNNIENGLLIEDSHNNVITQLTSSSNHQSGIRFAQNQIGPQNNFIAHATVANNKEAGVQFNSEMTQTHINSNILVSVLDSYNAPSSCGATNCSGTTSVTINDATLDTLFTLVSSDSKFGVVPDSGVNITAANQVFEFENTHRAWGSINMILTPTATAGSGSCNFPQSISDPESTCTILDWSINANDTTHALGLVAAPDTMLDFTFFSSTVPETLSYLNNASEIIGDAIGNENGMCEADEDCFTTPNIGSYQGHGALVTTDNTTATDNNINLFSYETNGR